MKRFLAALLLCAMLLSLSASSMVMTLPTDEVTLVYHTDYADFEVTLEEKEKYFLYFNCYYAIIRKNIK